LADPREGRAVIPRRLRRALGRVGGVQVAKRRVAPPRVEHHRLLLHHVAGGGQIGW